MATQRKSPKKGAAKTKKTSREETARKPTRRKVATAARKKTPSIESVARKIVRVTNKPDQFKSADLYSELCTSIEPGGGEPIVGLEGLDRKLAMWQSIVEEQSWKPQNVWIKGNTIAIQWEADLKFRDGRSVVFNEVAVHEVRGGKIVAERYYYDPTALARQPQEAAVPSNPEPPEPPVETRRTGPEPTPPPGSPPLDPIDL